VEGVRADDIKVKAWERTGLSTRRGCTDGQLGRNVADFDDFVAFATQIVDDLQPTLMRVGASGVSDKLAEFLRVFHVDALKRAAQPLEDGWGWRDKLIAHEVAERLLASHPGDSADPHAHFTRVMKVLTELAPIELDAATKALHLVVPFTWVDQGAVARIPAAVSRGMLVALNTVQRRTPEAYAVRHANWPVWNVRAVDPASDVEYVKTKSDIKVWLDKIDADRALYANAGLPEPEGGLDLVGVVCTQLNRELVEAVDEHLSERRDIGVVYLVGDLDKADVDRFLGARFEYVEPKLDRGIETAGLMRWDQGPLVLSLACDRDRAGLPGGA